VRRRLVGARIQAEVDHEGTFVFGGYDVVATKCVRLVVAEELRLEVLVDRDTVRLNVKGGDCLAGLRIENTASLSNSCGNVISAGEVVRSERSRVGVANRPRGNRGRGGVANTVNVALEAVPVAPFVGVTRSNRKVVANGRLLVELRADTGEDGLNRPLELREQNIGRLGGNILNLLAVNTDQREADALNVDVVNFGVNEDVVDVQLKCLNFLSANSRLLNNNRLKSLELAVRVQLCGGLSTLARTSRVEDFSGEAEEQVTGGNVNQAGLLSQRDGNKALAIRNRNRRNRETSVLVEPEEQRNPHVQGRLSRLGCLGTGAHVLKTARGQAGVNRRNRRGGTTNIGNQTNVVGSEDRGAFNRAEVTVALNRDFLTNQALPASELAGRNLKLLVQVGGFVLVVIERVAVDLELNLLKETLTGVLAVANKVLVNVSGTVNDSAVLLNVRIGKALVDAVGNIISRRLARRKVGGTNVRRERRDVAGRPVRSRNGLKLGVNNHVIKEITELRDRILNSRTICCAA